MHTQNTLQPENPMSLNYEHSRDHGQPEVITGVENLSVVKKICSRIMVLYSDYNIITYLNFRLKKWHSSTSLHVFQALKYLHEGKKKKKKLK